MYDGTAAVDDKQFRVIGVIIAGGLFLALFYLRFCGARQLPPVPPEPVFTERDIDLAHRTLRASPESYIKQLREDSSLVGVETMTPEKLGGVLPYSSDRTEKVLSPGDRITSVGLKIGLSVQEIEPGRDQMVLRITNTTDNYLAYRVVTEPTRGTAPCGRKHNLPHNAIALEPGATVTRSECIYRSGWKLAVTQVETIALNRLSFYYVSGVPPEQLGSDPRVSRGHKPPKKLRGCPNLITPVRITRARERGELSWRDLVDFYARHNCEAYRFPQNYRAFERPNQAPLPFEGSLR